MGGTPIPAGIAAGHPATAEAGRLILAAGGNAADAAVAATLASCVAETVMTGIAGGGHAIWWSASEGRAELLDFFVSVPGLGRPTRQADLLELDVPFGIQTVRYRVGIASCAVPGIPAGLDELWRRRGRLPWARLVEPALELARGGVPLPAAHASCLAMLEPVMTMREGARIYAPGGRLLETGDRLEQPGLVRALELVAEEGGLTFYEGTIARALLALVEERGGLVTAEDLAAYAPAWLEPTAVDFAGARVLTRLGLAGLAETLRRLPSVHGLTEADRALTLVEALDGSDSDGHTTNLTVVDSEGNACVVTTSLGLGSGDFLPGLDVHLNSMLGEVELLVGPLTPGTRMESMMAPTLVLDGGLLLLAAGAAGGSRLRGALVQVLSGILDEALPPQEAVDRPRLHPVERLVHLEPGFDERATAALVARGFDVQRWSELHHYFGGVSIAARAGLAADPRRSGLALPAPLAGGGSHRAKPGSAPA